VFGSTRSIPRPPTTGSASSPPGPKLRLLRLALMVQDREGYWWMECSACDSGWQVPRYETVG
jgi:hypothetical protein